MIIKTVEYEIPKDGDCRNCKNCLRNTFKLKDGTSDSLCIVFKKYGVINKRGCQACKVYIKEQTQCMKCIHQGDYPDWECAIGNDPKTCEEWSE